MTKIDELIQAHAQSVILDVLTERKIARLDFCQSKSRRFVTARRVAIRRMRADGVSVRHIALAMKMNKRMVEYHLNETVRLRAIARRCLRYAAAKQAAEMRA